MDYRSQWCNESHQLLRYLYEDLNIFNWSLISKELSERLHIQATPDECRNKFILELFRYVEVFGPVKRGDWIHEEEKELYRLHNENGNKWAVIAQNILGRYFIIEQRNDNCVKNHFYSKLRKSLRTINKIAKLHLKKDAKEISDVVIYKLTEATDESLKENSDLPQETIAMCYDLKNRLLEYEMDQRDIKENLDYRFEKELLHALAEFNKNYKKKSKKEKTLVLGTENLKKKKDTKENGNKNFVDRYQGSEDESSEKSVEQKLKKKKLKPLKKVEISNPIFFSFDELSSVVMSGIARSESEYSSSIPKKTVNLVIQQPSKEKNHKKSIDLLSSSRLEQKGIPSDNFIPFPTTSPKTKPKEKNIIEDILKAEGILENGVSNNHAHDQFFRRSSSVRSFSVCSSSENPDMFGDDVVFHGDFKELSEMDHDSQLFRIQQNDEKKDWN